MLCACGNAARYIDETGAFTCALCPLKTNRDSIRLSDVPQLLAWCRDLLGFNDLVDSKAARSAGLDARAAQLRSIIGRHPNSTGHT